MNMEQFKKGIKKIDMVAFKNSLNNLFECLDKEKELLIKLYESVLVKKYQEENPDATEVWLISYRENEDDRLKTYELAQDCITVRKYQDMFNNFIRRKKYRELQVIKHIFKKE